MFACDQFCSLPGGEPDRFCAVLINKKIDPSFMLSAAKQLQLVQAVRIP
jgi:hypothetical protein